MSDEGDLRGLGQRSARARSPGPKKSRRSLAEARSVVEKARQAAEAQSMSGTEALYVGILCILDELDQLREDVRTLNGRQSALMRAVQPDPDYWRNADPATGLPNMFEKKRPK